MSPKVLLVDDVKFFLELERSFLDREGFEVLVAESGREAIDLVRRERPGLVLLDLNMPGMSGDEVCRVLKHDPDLRGMPVIMVTSAHKDEDLKRCLAAGCDGFLRKPLSQVELLETIGRFLKAEARRAPRVPVRVPVTLEVEGGGAGKALEKGQGRTRLTATTVDVSTGGLYVELLDPPAVGTRITVGFTLPGFTVPVRAPGMVVWVNTPFEKVKGSVPSGMGLRFVDLAPGVKGVLELFVSRSLASRKGR
jgi:uncharacterized protein (TIGR02266 family)